MLGTSEMVLIGVALLHIIVFCAVYFGNRSRKAEPNEDLARWRANITPAASVRSDRSTKP